LAEGYSIFQYVAKYIILLTAINILLVFICQKIIAMNIMAQLKNYTVLIMVSVMAAIIAFIHYDVGAILGVFIIPVFLTVLFGKKKMTGVIAILNSILLALSAIHSAMAGNSVYFYLNVAVAFMLMVSAFLISYVLIEYIKANSDYVYASYRTQLSLNEQAQNDSLTGLYNQKTFQSLLKDSIEKATNLKSPMSLAIIDLDDFKEINDTFGHLEGDQVLIHFTNLLKQQFADGEAYISRYGGDEFVIIFPKASKELAYLKLEALRQRCKQLPHSQVRAGEISFSAGISHYMEGDMNETLLFHQADSALYRAKDNGKGQTVVYPD
ncbi:MAG TPA: GGDEF domain-containing protein, partial [Anaerovoracaceae bacterium]|nr:GGDEF domain-containing protein [Anaerovoracaceae bacterium]